MVRRRSTVRFRNGAPERKHEKRHLTRPEADRVAFSLFRLSTVVAGLLRRSVPNTCRNSQPPSAEASPSAEGNVVLPVEALGVDLEQDGHAVTGPLGDLGGRDAAIEPRRDACVPEVVRAACQRRGGLGRAQGCGCRLFIHAGQAACRYSWRTPPSRSRLRTSRCASRSGLVIGPGSGHSGAASARVL
jgi:hypothetical protein